MNYELAKQLKDAGFPQSKYGTFVYSDESHVKCDGYKCACPRCYGYDEGCYVPTLSSLIKACKYGFNSFEKIFNHVTEDGLIEVEEYLAVGTSGNEYCNKDISVKGETPEEAIANLWLLLNTKKK